MLGNEAFEEMGQILRADSTDSLNVGRGINLLKTLQKTFRLSLPLQTFSKSPSGRLSPVR